MKSTKRRSAGIWLAVGWLICATAGCATGALRAGREAERAEDYDRAVVEYTKALRERPTDRQLRA
ncbi:MAG: hypothetical protein AB7I50_24255, partial [Vicinamibacterales bacterium]